MGKDFILDRLAHFYYRLPGRYICQHRCGFFNGV